MTNRTDPDGLLARRILTTAIVALALAASAYLTQNVDAAHPLPAALMHGLDPLSDPVARPAARMNDDTDPSVPSASSVFERSIASGVDDTPPSF